MQYRSEKPTPLLLIVWNTRDGITPFMFHIEEREFQHVNWKQDQPKPDHVPDVGDYVFVDFTLERAVERRTAYVERLWDQPMGRYEPMSTHYPSKESAILQLAQNDSAEFGGGPPFLLRVTEDWRQGFLDGSRPDEAMGKVRETSVDYLRGFHDGRRNITGPLPEPPKSE